MLEESVVRNAGHGYKSDGGVNMFIANDNSSPHFGVGYFCLSPPTIDTN